MSAVLLPFTADGDIDWVGFEAHLGRTVEAGIVPAVNMDTGFGPYLSPAERSRGAGPHHAAGARRVRGRRAGRRRARRPVRRRRLRAGPWPPSPRPAARPIVFPSHGLAAVPEGELVDAHARLAADVDRFLGFELGAMFHPAGRIWSLETFEAMLELPALVGAKHSSLQRGPELDRLDVRDRVRPDFLVLTGNDLAIDQVVYGSDYLLGLSTFAPDAFAARDQAWAAGDELRFWELNDLLQYLGQLTFRAPCPATATTRRCSSSSAARSARVAPTPTPPPAPTPTAPCSPTSPPASTPSSPDATAERPPTSRVRGGSGRRSGAGDRRREDDLVEQGEGPLGDDGPGLLGLQGAAGGPGRRRPASSVSASSAAVTDAAVWPHGMPAGPSTSVR